MASSETKSYARRDRLLEIEVAVRKWWEDDEVFKSESRENLPKPEEKFFSTFPFPCMNGYLHTGHAFSLSKVDFASAYHRLRDANVLLPFGFHCTGMPIKASADKLSREIQQFGNPPVFSAQDDTIKQAPETQEESCDMLIKEALKNGFYDLQAARDEYGLSCGSGGMNHDLILHFMDVQTHLIEPIRPQFAEYVWRKLFKKEGCVVTAGWPTSDEPDLVLKSANKYLQDSIVLMRKLLQKQLLEILAERREILQKEGQSENFKQIQKLCMPFLKFKKDEAISIGPQALKLRLPFGEIEVLQSNMDLIKRQENPPSPGNPTAIFVTRHHSIISRIADWEGIKKSRSVREFDNYATRLVAKFDTTDTYYRRSSSAQYVGNVSVPLLCTSALDDPVCNREAIPWDECSSTLRWVFMYHETDIPMSQILQGKQNIVLATTTHGGHLAYYEGMTATSMWWARAVQEYFEVLLSSPFADRRRKMQIIPEPVGSLIDQGPFVDAREDRMVVAASEVDTRRADAEQEDSAQIDEKTSNHPHKVNTPQVYSSLLGPLKKRVDELSRYSRKSIWLLAYIAIVTTWPLLGPALLLSIKKRFREIIEK
ncbi:unnamed protein product [Arabidopsis arenosa]|uniref:leucine--tRNA ligase n=1 Tax=Arabidopsis arenosa TaxID=38785 RepID=A0A8S1ZYT9_ARAAE|nr:unnamed protein product [Arabidopsis arenosa]